MSTTVAPSPALLFDTMTAFQRTAALRAAIDLELFTAVAEGASTVSAIAARCHAATRSTRMLCDYLTVIGFLSKTGDAYQLTPDSAVFLNKKSPAYLGTMIDFLGSPTMMHNFDGLTETVRRGTITPAEDTVAAENPIWEQFARAMAPMMMMPAQAIAEILGVANAGAMRVLDIAAGHGVFGIAIAQRNSAAEVTAVDWKGVLKAATDNAAKMGVAARHRTIAGDAFSVDFGSGYQIALMTNFLHHFDVPTCTRLLRKVAASLEPGGRVAVLEFVPNDDRVSPPAAATFVMNMLAGTAAGDAFTLRELRGMLEASGFRDVQAHPLPPGPETLIVATK